MSTPPQREEWWYMNHLRAVVMVVMPLLVLGVPPQCHTPQALADCVKASLATFSPAGENERLLLAWLYLMYGCTIAGPALGLVSAMRFVISPGKPVWVRVVSLPWALLNALLLFIFYHLHQRL
ncbi:MAG: hypothetical protein EOP88_07650 [Verrucomicrobiaceae bacterium]|nr:MAG: hypothetical protein EOP88_07650 [Verrucomicrobiaceae bacterium]